MRKRKNDGSVSGKKLILFDIDGTLLTHAENVPKGIGWKRFKHVAKVVYGVDVPDNPSINFHGMIDYQILFELVSTYGVSRSVFDEKFPGVPQVLYDFATTFETERIYAAIPDAERLLKKVLGHPDAFIPGILTGNVEKMVYWKLRHIGIDPSWFTLIVASDEFKDRISVAKSVFAKAEKHAGLHIGAEDIYIIGDAIGDVRCARAIGAHSIIATTGKHGKDELLPEKPTLIVDSLMDTKVLKLLGLQ